MLLFERRAFGMKEERGERSGIVKNQPLFSMNSLQAWTCSGVVSSAVTRSSGL